MKTTNKYFIIIVCLIFCGLVYLLAPILTPFFVGILLAYLADPLVSKLVSWRVPRLASVIIVFLALFGVLVSLILLLIPLVQDQIDILMVTIPNIITWVQDSIIPWLTQHFGVNEGLINVGSIKSMIADNWTKAGGMADWLLKTILHSGFRIVEWLVNLVLIPVVTFYLLCDWKQVVAGLRNLLPRQQEPTIVKLVKECDTVLSAFFRGQLLVMLALSTFYSAGLILVGLQLGLLIGVIAGILTIVPYLGFIVGISIASIASLVQFGDMSSLMLVWLVFIIGHLCENMFLTPKLVGDRIGLHPVAVIFAVLAGGSLFGFVGVLLALPVAAVIMVWVRYLHQRYRRSKLYQET